MDERSSLRFFNTYALSTKVMQDVVTKPVPRKVLGHPFPCDSVTVLATASYVSNGILLRGRNEVETEAAA